VATREEVPTRRRSDSEAESVEPRLKVLAVDDDIAYLRYVEYVLTRAGFDVELAYDGITAIERICKGGRVDLLLMDLTMPGIDGIETVRRIKQEPQCSSLYTILLTASSGTETKLRALENGLDDYLSKASSESEILAKIRSAARRLQMERRLHVQNEQLQALALTDELTGIANRRALFRAGEDVLRAGRTLSAVLFDLDQFKQVNDTFGHLAGDRILADVAAAFREHTRYGDVIGRYGGDEFVLLLPDTDLEEGRQIAERLMTKIRQLSWTILDTPVAVSAQCGFAESEPGSTLPDLLAQCDRMLYGKKKRGRIPPEARVRL
jgi:diguanylate cyclase (GGDEF)-like protein